MSLADDLRNELDCWPRTSTLEKNLRRALALAELVEQMPDADLYPKNDLSAWAAKVREALK